jgi:hypothetical protein
MVLSVEVLLLSSTAGSAAGRAGPGYRLRGALAVRPVDTEVDGYRLLATTEYMPGIAG